MMQQLHTQAAEDIPAEVQLCLALVSVTVTNAYKLLRGSSGNMDFCSIQQVNRVYLISMIWSLREKEELGDHAYYLVGFVSKEMYCVKVIFNKLKTISFVPALQDAEHSQRLTVLQA